MTKIEFISGLPFKMAITQELQPVYSYVNVGSYQCIQVYTIAAPEPRYHCKVVSIQDAGITVRVDVLGHDLTIVVSFDNMHRIGNPIPIKGYTRDCMQADIYEDGTRYKVIIKDLYTGIVEKHLTETWATMEGADSYARSSIGYK